MSASFYNESGRMFGLDVHKYWVPVVPPPALTAHVVTIPFTHCVDDEAKVTSRVTSARRRMFHAGVSFTYVPHVPIPPGLPCPAREPLEYVTIIWLSKSKAALAVGTVTGQNKPLAVCVAGAWGANVNCNEVVPFPTGVVMNFNSVVTTPTAADFAMAAVDWAVDVALGKLLDETLLKAFMPRIGKALGKALDKLLPKSMKDRLAEPVRKAAESLVKGKVKSIFKDIYKDIKKDILSRVHAEVP